MRGEVAQVEFQPVLALRRPIEVPLEVPLEAFTHDRTERTLDPLSLKFVIASRTARGPVLDFGCGEGKATIAALARGARVCAVDPEESRISRLLREVPL